MKLLRSFVFVAGIALALGASADRASAGPPCIGCNHGGPGRGPGPGPGGPPPQRTTLFGSPSGNGHGLNLFQPKPKLPVFQAAPWYQYWPYDGHFMTPAPINGGAFYGPPMTGNFPVNPYFPGAQPNYGYGSGYGYPALPPGTPQPYPPPGPMPLPQPMPVPPGR